MEKLKLKRPCEDCAEVEALVESLVCQRCAAVRARPFAAVPAWIDEWWRENAARIDGALTDYKALLKTPVCPDARSFADVFPVSEPLREQIGAYALERVLHVAPLPRPWGPISRYCTLEGVRGWGSHDAMIVLPAQAVIDAIESRGVLSGVGGIAWLVDGHRDGTATISFRYQQALGQQIVARVPTDTVPLVRAA